MKEKDFDKCIDNIIIDGIIKEAEQDNADFATAAKNMSKEDFESIVREPSVVDMDDDLDLKTPSKLSTIFDSCTISCFTNSSNDEEEVNESQYNTASRMPDEIPGLNYSYNLPHPTMERSVAEDRPTPPADKSRLRLWRPWIDAAISAAAIIMLILIPSINSMNARLCDSALYMSEAYITAPKGGFDVAAASIEQIKEELPNLERLYNSSIFKRGDTYYYRDGFRDAGRTLVVAYLKLHKKGAAVKVLKTLEAQSQGMPFGDHCRELLRQLE